MQVNDLRHTVYITNTMNKEIASKVNIRVLHEYKEKKLVKFQSHPERDLLIWNYTDIVQMRGPWDDITTLTRGLVTDKEGNIKARSFKKFHNIEQQIFTPTEKFKVYEKLDGSLGILFWHENTWILCSRGSFTSDQAKMGSYLLKTKYTTEFLDKRYAYSFEIIYPENRIVVDYKDKEELVFLAAFDIASGEEVHDDKCYEDIKKCGFPFATYYDYDDYENLKNLDWENSEGFVVVFENGDRVKIKFDEYLKLHRKMTNINGLIIWEWFSSRKKLDVWILKEDLPDEIYGWVQQKWDSLQKQYDDIEDICKCEYEKLRSETVLRSDFAKRAITHEYAKILFEMYNEHDVSPSICKLIKPKNGVMDVPYSGKLKKVLLDEMQTPVPHPPSITILVGVSASGKSTWANEYIRSNKKNTIKVSRDGLRKHIYGYDDSTIREYYKDMHSKDFNERENIISKLEIEMIRNALKLGKNVIVDNTNLKKTYIQQYLKTFVYNDINFKVFDDVDTETCIERDIKRVASVGPEVIRKQMKEFTSLKKTFQFTTQYAISRNTLEQNIRNAEVLPKCYVFDIDGTLAHNSHRSPYDWSLVLEDGIYEHVKDILHIVQKSGYKIAICTGRDVICENETKEWLKMHGIQWDMFMCRSKGDYRPDWIVKEEMWKKIMESYSIVAMFDDRDCVVQHARYLGFNVYQVNYGDF